MKGVTLRGAGRRCPKSLPRKGLGKIKNGWAGFMYYPQLSGLDMSTPCGASLLVPPYTG